jgi:hypothetical protein
VIELGAVTLTKAIKDRLIENLVEALVERVVRCGWAFGAVKLMAIAPVLYAREFGEPSSRLRIPAQFADDDS